MTSPFERRASEQIPDVGAFLAYVAPSPLEVYFQERGENDTLYDRLAVITGSPGSGKTTVSRLFGFETLFYLHQNGEQPALNDLYRQMDDCRALDSDFPMIAGTRLSMEINYRDFWECPYEPSVKNRLVQALISARAVLGWAREFTEAGIPLDQVRAVFRPEAAAGADAVGGESLEDMRKTAAAVERETYHIATALIPPKVETLSSVLTQGYQPIEVLSGFSVTFQRKQYALRPLVMLDDVHALHIEQRKAVLRWLVRRDIAIARWILWRFDALDPNHVLYDRAIVADFGSDDPDPGLQVAREVTEIRLQQNRRNGRAQFRRMARQMGRRYLNQMEVFKAVGVESLEEMLEKRMTDIPASVMDKISARTRAIIKRSRLPAAVVEKIEGEVDEYIVKREFHTSEAAALKEGIVAILVARTANRTPQSSLFGEAPTDDEVDALAAKPKLDVEQGARLQLSNVFDIPYYYGPDALYDSGSENAEQFLQMAAPMIKLLRVKTIRKRERVLTAKDQDATLRAEASRIVDGWNFPEFHAVRRLVERIAVVCLERSMAENAPLGAGASAVGIPMDEYKTIAEKHPNLARVLQFGMAYNALTLVPDYSTKLKSWCLIELGGAILLKAGLTFQKGGFVEWRLKDVLEHVQEPAA